MDKKFFQALFSFIDVIKSSDELLQKFKVDEEIIVVYR